MPEYLAPGVYLEEVPSGNKPIEGVSTATAGVVGISQRGPVNTPTLVTSFGEFSRVFGGLLDHRVFTDGKDAMPYAVQGFFNNGGQRVFVSRIIGSGARFASTDLFGVPATGQASTALSQRGAEGDAVITIDSGTNIDADDVLLLEDDVRSEHVTAQSAPVEMGIRLAGNLRGDHADGDDVTPQTVTEGAGLTAEISGDMSAGGGLALTPAGEDALAAGNVLRIRDTGDDSRTEYVTITADDSADFDEGTLLFDHPQATTEIHVVTLAAGTAVTLASDVSEGDFLLPLSSTAGLSDGDVVMLGSELHVVRGVVSSLSIATTTLRFNHAGGVAVTKQVPLVRVHAKDPGVWGNDLRIKARPSSLLESTVNGAVGAGESMVTLGAVFGLFNGSVLEFRRDDAVVTTAQVRNVNRATNEVELAVGLGDALQDSDEVRSLEFDLIIDRMENGKPIESEAFERLGIDPSHNRYAPKIVGSFDRDSSLSSDSGDSELVRVSDLTRNDDGSDDEDLTGNRTSVPYGGIDRFMSDGFDDLPSVDDDTYVGVESDDPESRTGVRSLENEDSISIVAVPGQPSVALQKALLGHCEKMRYRFAVLEPPIGSNMKQAQTHRQNFDTTRGAIYYPWLVVPDRFGEKGDLLKIPPSGHVMGIYARTDTQRGVWKAPANEVVRGILNFETTLTKGEQDILNPVHVNAFRDFRTANRGLRLWGARTLSSDPEWKYVNVRRLFLFLEKSIENGMQFAVFESNTESLWATVKQSISSFLTTVWRDGGLEGTTEEEAYFVSVGFNVTMTQADIDNGRLIVEVGVAPVKPAEFVIIRISQKTREATA